MAEGQKRDGETQPLNASETRQAKNLNIRPHPTNEGEQNQTSKEKGISSLLKEAKEKGTEGLRLAAKGSLVSLVFTSILGLLDQAERIARDKAH